MNNPLQLDTIESNLYLIYKNPFKMTQYLQLKWNPIYSSKERGTLLNISIKILLTLVLPASSPAAPPLSPVPSPSSPFSPPTSSSTSLGVVASNRTPRLDVYRATVGLSEEVGAIRREAAADTFGCWWFTARFRHLECKP
ncbi:unnamed protein product [Acanthoscelides obtectus]|uniref:Uncharacterized protein n=1 Tax=Acanthoscelides obtectus TaxID=200917 RepID=A0A9P0KNK8_ACAOB|nr:unnamed protein product [Acanthoscelides obtectus]CAK1660562.1 hypothetical protein AOBTE_LOCUS22148 [Acanthoscelides obtectus]